MVKQFKEMFSELFTLVAWVSLLGFIIFCVATGRDVDDRRDAWNVLILIAGYIWGKAHSRSASTVTDPGTTTTELNLMATTVTDPLKTNEDEKK